MAMMYDNFGTALVTQRYKAPNGGWGRFDEIAPLWTKMGYDLDPSSGATTRSSVQTAPAPTQGGGSNPLTGGLPSSGAGGAMSLGDLTNIADPWSSQRGQYQTQLSSLMKDPSSFLKSDLFKASTAAGLEGINRSAAAGGMLKSGNRLQALMDYGQKNAPENFFRMADLLSGFGGAKNQNPGGGLSAFANLQNANTSAFNADTSRRAQEAGMQQWNTGRQDQIDQQKRELDQLTQWQQQQQQQQNWQRNQDLLNF